MCYDLYHGPSLRRDYIFYNKYVRFDDIFSCGEQLYKHSMSVCLSIRLSIPLC